MELYERSKESYLLAMRATASLCVLIVTSQAYLLLICVAPASTVLSRAMRLPCYNQGSLRADLLYCPPCHVLPSREEGPTMPT